MEPKAAIPANVSAVCAKVSYLIGHIESSLNNDRIEDKLFKGSKFKNFIDELIKEAQNGKTTALALNLCALRDGLKHITQPDLKEPIGNAIWHCERAIEALFELEKVNPTAINPFFNADSSDDD
jgi:hypothetical protein